MPDFYDNNPNGTPGDQEPRPFGPRRVVRREPGDTIAVLSMLCGIASVFLMLVGGSLLFGSLGVVFALLSRTEKMPSRAKTGMFLSVLSLTIYIVAVVVVMYILTVTGTLDAIMADLAHINMDSINAYSDIVAVIQEHILDLYTSLLGQTSPDLIGGMV